MSRLIALLTILAILSVAAVVVVELQALSPRTPRSPEEILFTVRVQAARVPARIAVAGSLGLLTLAMILRMRRPRPRAVLQTDEPVTEPETFPQGAKQALAVVSVLMMAFGGLTLVGSGGLGSLLGLLRFAPVLGALAFAFLAGGILAFLQVRRSLAGVPSRRLRLPAPWMLVLGFALVVAAGEITRRTRDVLGLDFAVLLFLGAALPPLTVLALASEEVGVPPTRRRVALALVAGGTLSVLAAIVLEVLLPGIIALLALPAGNLVREIIAVIDQGKFSDLLSSPASLFLLAELTLVAPLVEEATKPLAVIFLGRRIQHARDALLIGIGCGAGFAIIENIAYEGGGLHLWTGITLIRGIGAALHPFGAGLMSVGWYGVVHQQPGAWHRLARFYLLAVGAHAIWNGAAGIFFLLESSDRGVLGPVDLQGVIIDSGLVALFLAEGVALLWAVRQLARSLAAPGAVVSALSPTRALALWGIACLGVLLPVGIAAGHAMLRYLGAMLPR